MKKTSVAAALGGAFLVSAFASGSAAAQSMGPPNGAEITGHAVQVDTNGVVNTVYFDQGGAARIVSQGGTEVQGRWFVENQNLCLATGSTARECWPYQAAFRAGQPVVLTSDCQATSRWTAMSTTEPPLPPPVRRGERG